MVVLSVSEKLLAGDGSGTRILPGTGGLLGVPTRGFHLELADPTMIGDSGSGRNSGIAVR